MYAIRNKVTGKLQTLHVSAYSYDGDIDFELEDINSFSPVIWVVESVEAARKVLEANTTTYAREVYRPGFDCAADLSQYEIVNLQTSEVVE